MENENAILRGMEVRDTYEKMLSDDQDADSVPIIGALLADLIMYVNRLTPGEDRFSEHVKIAYELIKQGRIK